MRNAAGDTMRTGDRRALAASLLLHALAAAGTLLIPRGPLPSFAPDSDIAIDFTLAEPNARDDQPVAQTRDSPSAPLPLHDRRLPRQRTSPGGIGSASGGRSIAPTPSAEVSDSDRTHSSTNLMPSDQGSATGDVPSPDVQVRAIDSVTGAAPSVNLSFDGLASDAKFRALPPARSDPLLYPRTTGSHRKRGGDELIREGERNDDAEENVRRGRAHPLLFEYLRGTLRRLEPDATRLAEELPLGPSLSIRGWGRGYLGRLAEVDKPISGRDLRDSTVYDPTGGRRPDLFQAYNEASRQAVAGAEQRTADICLGVAADRPVVITLRRSSGHAALDQLALDSFQKAVLSRPMAADIRPGLACYLVRISAFRAPPLSVLSFGIRNGKPDVSYPLKRMTKVTVELMSVDYGDDNKQRSVLHAR
ncbi:MAG: hypothetical protein ABUS79_02525 [Pseudomonadota bacterium]